MGPDRVGQRSATHHAFRWDVTRSHGPPWECRPGRSASSSVGRGPTRSVEDGIPTRERGNEGKPAWVGEGLVPRRPRLSIARVMALVAVTALDCVVLRGFFRTRNPEGLLTLTQSLTLALVGVVLARNSLRRFSAGFVVSGFATAAGLIALL